MEERHWTSFIPLHKHALVQALTPSLPFSLLSLFLARLAHRKAIVIGFSFRDRAKTARWKYITGSQLQPDWRLDIGRCATGNHTRPMAHTMAPGTDSLPVVLRQDTYNHLFPIYISFSLILSFNSSYEARRDKIYLLESRVI